MSDQPLNISRLHNAVSEVNDLLTSAALLAGTVPVVTVTLRDTGLSQPIPQLTVTVEVFTAGEDSYARPYPEAKFHWLEYAIFSTQDFKAGCGRRVRRNRGNQSAAVVARRGDACLTCLNKIWNAYPDLRAREQEG